MMHPLPIPLSHSDQLRLQHAEGYLELGMWEDAWKVLEEMGTAEALKLRVAILMATKKWEKAVILGESLCKMIPTDEEPFIQTAFCFHELKRTEEARKILLSGPSTFQENPLFHYNLGCYEAQLGDLKSAIKNVKRSIELDRSFRKIAIEDSDLKPIWRDLKSPTRLKPPD